MEEPSIDLSFAEVSFLLAITVDDSGVTVMKRLGLVPLDESDPVAQAGLSSLAARSLAGLEQASLTLAPQLGAVMAGLCTAQQHATLAVGAEDEMSVMQVFIGEQQNLMVEPLAFGVFRFVGLSDDASTSGIASALVKTLRAGGSLLVQTEVSRVGVKWGDDSATIQDGDQEQVVDAAQVPLVLEQLLAPAV